MKEGYIIYGSIIAVASIIAGGCFAQAGLLAIAVCLWIVTVASALTACIMAVEKDR